MLNKLFKNIVIAIAKLIPFWIYRLFIKRKSVIFCYHVVSDSPLQHIAAYRYKNSGNFENDILYLQKNFRLYSYAEFKECLGARLSLREQGALLTFDDGLAQSFTVIRQILLKHRVPAVFFVSTDFIDNKKLHKEQISFLTASGIDAANYLKEYKPFLSANQIRILYSEGFTIGAHGLTHTRLDLLSETEAEKEIVESARIIMELTGAGTVPFAFPYSGLYLDRDFLQRIKEKYSFIDLFFDSKHLRKDRDFVQNRVWVDETSIRGALCHAYLDCLLYRFLRF